MRILLRICLFFLIGLILSCAAPPKKPAEPKVPIERDPFSIIPEQYQSKALEFEKNGELRKALQSWEIVGSFIPTDEAVAKRIVDLKTQILTMADHHFKRGLAYYQSNSVKAAQKEFLLSLCHDPEHKEALYYLKDKLVGEDYTLYQVQKGDTLKQVAQKKYNDPRKDFLIAYFNDLKTEAKLVTGTTLRLPVLESTPTKQTMDTQETAGDTREISKDTKEMLSKALAYHKAKNYRETVSISERVLEYDPANREARDLINESHYQMGKSLTRGKKYQEALEVFNRLDSGYKDVKESIALVKKQLAGEHYLRGIKYFTDEELDKAIKEWEVTLALDPNHPKVKKDIENARSLLQKLKEIK